MKNDTLPAIIISVAIVAAGFLVGGRYEIVRADGNAVTRLDRFTGEVSMCVADISDGCGFVQEKTPAPARAAAARKVPL